MNKVIQNSLLFLILVSIVFFNSKTTILQFEYSFFNESFTAQFCENKAKPELKCNGKCYLKKIDKEQNNQDSSKKLSSDNEVLFLCPPPKYANTFIINSPKKKIYSKKDLFQVQTNHPLEHPPQSLI